jgi:hypothetical protein
MDTNQSGTGRPEDPGQGGVNHSAFALLKDEEDRSVLRLWRESLSLLDPRYESKVLLKLVALAMTDEQIRSRLIYDTESFLGELQTERQSNFDLQLPEVTTLRFLENTQDTLNVILPPRAGGMMYSPSGQLGYRSPERREALRSRTSSALPRIFMDDYDVGDLHDTHPLGNTGNALNRDWGW